MLEFQFRDVGIVVFSSINTLWFNCFSLDFRSHVSGDASVPYDLDLINSSLDPIYNSLLYYYIRYVAVYTNGARWNERFIWLRAPSLAPRSASVTHSRALHDERLVGKM